MKWSLSGLSRAWIGTGVCFEWIEWDGGFEVEGLGEF